MAAYTYEAKEHVQKLFKKMDKKSHMQLLIIRKKLAQILDDPYRFKPLNKPMQGIRAVHVDKSFVLTYSIDEARKVVIIEDYDHHDNIYEVSA